MRQGQMFLRIADLYSEKLKAECLPQYGPVYGSGCILRIASLYSETLKAEEAEDELILTLTPTLMEGR